MNITNWLKAGRKSKKLFNVIVGIHSHTKGSLGDCEWNDYVQIKFYSKEKEAFIKLTMTPEEAFRFNEKLTAGLNKFSKY